MGSDATRRRWVLLKGWESKCWFWCCCPAMGRTLGCTAWEMARPPVVAGGRLRIAQQMAEVFPRQRFLLDRYHLLEHLHEGASAVAAGDGESAQAWVSEQVGRIDRARAAAVVAEFRGHPGMGGEHPLNRLAGYLESRQEQLDYATAREQGLPLGSGAVEAGHRHVIQARLKLPGTWWKVDTVNPMLALRTLRANGQWDAFWH